MVVNGRWRLQRACARVSAGALSLPQPMSDHVSRCLGRRFDPAGSRQQLDAPEARRRSTSTAFFPSTYGERESVSPRSTGSQRPGKRTGVRDSRMDSPGPRYGF